MWPVPAEVRLTGKNKRPAVRGVTPSTSEPFLGWQVLEVRRVYPAKSIQKN
jgi:hypothetical protein